MDNKVKLWLLLIFLGAFSLTSFSSDAQEKAPKQFNEFHIAINQNSSPKSPVNLTLVNTLIGNNQWGDKLAISRDGKTLISSGGDKVIKFWSLNNGQLIQSFNADNQVTSLAISPDNRTLAYSSRVNNTIKVVNLNNGRLLTTIKPSKEISEIAITPDGKTLVVNAQEGVYLWNLMSGIRIRTLSKSDLINHIAISPNGQTLVGAGDINNSDHIRCIKIWNLNTGKLLHTISSRSGLFISSIAISPNNSTLAAGWAGGDVQNGLNTWDIKTGKLLKDFRKYSDFIPEITSVTFSADGSYLATGSTDADEDSIHPIHVWNTQTGNLLGKFPAHPGSTSNLIFSPDGRTLVSSGGNHQIKVWRLQRR